MQCPKCHGAMRTYNRQNVQIEQCDNCRGIFLDYGELEHLAQMEARYAAPPPPPQPGYHQPPPAPGYAQPAWGAQHGHYGKKKKGWSHMLFSS